jgi:hypothetical protein
VNDQYLFEFLFSIFIYSLFLLIIELVVRPQHVFRNWFIFIITGFFNWPYFMDNTDSKQQINHAPYQAVSAPAKPNYLRPSTAPNGQKWPTIAGYIAGYQRLNNDGLSNVTVDNSRNDSDVFVKLVYLNGGQALPVCQFYIPAFGSFTLNNIRAGSYDIRYRDLINGGLARSEAFNLEELATYNGTQYSNITMTLYKVHNGNMQTYGLSESEF